MREEARAGDARCPTCGGSAHALDAAAQAKFGGRTHVPKGVRARLDEAWSAMVRADSELDLIYAHLRAVVENCKHSSVEAIRHQLVGLLPEVQAFEPDVAARMRERGMGHLVDRREQMAREAWAKFGYPPEA